MLFCIGALCKCCTAIAHVQQFVKYWPRKIAFWTETCYTDHYNNEFIKLLHAMPLIVLAAALLQALSACLSIEAKYAFWAEIWIF